MTKDQNPYAQARLEFENLMRKPNAIIRNWQRIAYILATALVCALIAIIILSQKDHVVPYVVEVDDLGRAIAVNEAKSFAITDDKVIKAFLYQYLDMARSVIADTTVIKKNLNEVYNMSTPSVSSNFLGPFYKDNNPFDFAQNKGTKHLEPLSCLKQAENTYLVEWREFESDYDNKVLDESTYKALITVVEVTPTKESQYREDPLNPFGLYVTSLSWTKEI